MIRALGYIIAIIFFCSCSKELDTSDFLATETETINGFEVTWQNYMTADRRQVVRDILRDMVYVKGGVFSMGTSQTYDDSARPNESPIHWVELSDYYICAHELTYDQVQLLLGTTRSSNIRDYNGKYLHYSWEDWQHVLFMLEELTGIEFSFPTEAQWEFAARGGVNSKGYRYPGSNNWKDVWSESLDESNTSAPNELGLYNMADKNSEWCLDFYADYTDGVMQRDPCVTFDLRHGHVVRGGCHVSSEKYKNWMSTASVSYTSFSTCYIDQRMCRSTARSYSRIASWDIGCRPVINNAK